ncbi:MAG: glutamate--tRNA ligase [Mariprofundaceae bacterium]
MKDIVTRFAPSPTGLMHLGNVRTALLNWLYAKKHGGRFLLRFEDTDRARSEVEYMRSIEQDLTWLGLDWDGDVLFQSANCDKHQVALDALAEKGLAYRCFCSESQLAIDRKLATSRGLPPRYSQRCRHISISDSKLRAVNEPHVWRLAIHHNDGDVYVQDTLRGDVHFACRDLDDPVVVRSDGSFTFLLPNAIDDAIDGITHTLRGDDHLTNSAYQVWLLQGLGYTPPVYLHHGLLLGEDGAKLSKRTGSHSVEALRKEGLLSDALTQTMTRLGHPNMPDDAISLETLAASFDAQHVSTASVRWSDGEMWRWHTRLLHGLSASSLVPLIQPHLPNLDSSRLLAFAALLGGNIERAEDVLGFVRLLDAKVAFSAPVQSVVDDVDVTFFQQAKDLWCELDSPDWKAWTGKVKEVTGCKGKILFLPLRVALTGALHGPEMRDVITFLGRDGVSERLSSVLVQKSG